MGTQQPPQPQMSMGMGMQTAAPAPANGGSAFSFVKTAKSDDPFSFISTTVANTKK
jgi:hypothetical protein